MLALDIRIAFSIMGVQTVFAHANSNHDQAIAFAAGDLIFAEAIERHMQCKHSLGTFDLSYSWRAIRDAVKKHGVSLGKDVLVRTTWDAPGGLSRLVAATSLASPIPLPPLPEAALATHSLTQSLFRLERLIVEEALHDAASLPRWKWGAHIGGHRIRTVPTRHHLAHAANAVYTSPFSECVVMIVDGAGDHESVSVYHFKDGSFRLLSRSGGEQTSVGVLYSAVTQLCGFSTKECEEWKVMGLAAYGEHDPKIFEFFRSRTHVEGLELKLKFNIFRDNWVEDLEKLTGPFRAPNEGQIVEKSARLAKSFQDYFEDVLLELTTNIRRLGLSENLAFAGGCALNSSANGKIVSASGFKQMHIPCAPADDGNALGALLYELHHERKVPWRPQVMSPYLGSVIPDEDVARIASFSGFPHVEATSDDDLCEQLATILASGKIIGFCQGRAEFGPRALGNRSILADPRVPDMREQINNRVKFREEYRPLAPSILAEYGGEYFEDFQDSPYMERTLRFRDGVKGKVPGVVHRDGTGRLQTVTPDGNPLYHRLIEAFRRKTGIPLLLNTSFNVMGKPIVHSAADAMTVFVTTGLDALAIGRHIFRKPGA
jgi:carbamoyltransferase